MNQITTTRKRLGLTQEAMARRLGISWRHYQRLEAGDRDPGGAVQVLLDMMNEGEL
jgi:DNA-binding transcriptional regulator YiaG